MLEIQVIREDKASVIPKLRKKHVKDAENVVEKILELDEKRRAEITLLEKYRAEMNESSRAIGQLMRDGMKEKAEAAKQRTSDLKQQIKDSEESLAEVEGQLHELLVQLPNLPHDSVPEGKTAEDNEIVFENQRTVAVPENAKPHWELAAQHDIIDFELGVKLTGAGFPVYKGKGAKLQRGLIRFFLEEAEKAGYTEIQPPLMVNEDSGFGTGQLPDKEGQMYHITADNLYLIPTAEVPITNLYRDVILDGEVLPVKNCGYTPCFRREAGSYGKDVRGLNRLHQFDKVEIVQIVEPEKSYEVLETMLDYVKNLLEKLELKCRVALLCGGDMSFASAKTYDMEVWSGAQERWLEVSSISNFETFQSNRMKLRYRTADNRKVLAHTLNGSALALPRIVAALLENNQQADGSILIPAALQEYVGYDKIG